MKKVAVMWLIAKDGIALRSVWDALNATLDCSDQDLYSSSVHKDEIELHFDYKEDESALLNEALKWGRAEMELAPLCRAINISIGYSDYEKEIVDGDI